MKLLMTTGSGADEWTYAVELSRGLAARGVAVFLAVVGKQLLPEQRRPLENVPNLLCQEWIPKLDKERETAEQASAAERWLRELARKVRPDVVHLNSFFYGAFDWEIPTLVAGHSCPLSRHRAVTSREAGLEWDRYRNMVASNLQAADRVSTSTNAMLADLQRYYGPLRRCSVISNGRCAVRYHARGKRPLVLSEGVWGDEAKNIQALASSARGIDWPIYIANPPYELGDSVAGLATSIALKFLGPLSPPARIAWLARASIYAMPARHEPFGFSILEAALSECALVLGDIPALREVWSDCALFVPSDDHEALAIAMRTLIADADLRRQYGTRARTRAQEFSLEAMVDPYFHVYQQLLERKSASTRS